MLTPENVRAVFGLESRIITGPVSGKPLMLPVGRYHSGPLPVPEAAR